MQEYDDFTNTILEIVEELKNVDKGMGINIETYIMLNPYTWTVQKVHELSHGLINFEQR